MLSVERKNKILNLLRNKKTVTTNFLCDTLFVSQSTVRRDLIEMEKDNLIIRFHGGAMLPPKSTNEQSYTHRGSQYQSEKIVIANMASTFIQDGTSLFLDSSTTINAIIPFLKGFKDLTIITNGLQNALSLSKYKNLDTVLIGGSIYPGSSSTVGINAYTELSNYIVDFSIMSCKGLDGYAVYEANESQAIIKQKMIKNSQIKLLLCDSSKFNKNFFYKLTDIDTFDYIITDSLPNKKIQQVIENKGVLLIES